MSECEHYKFFINGQAYLVNQSITLIQVLEYLNYEETLFVIEYNSVICSDTKNKYIKHMDKIEIITIMGGG